MSKNSFYFWIFCLVPAISFFYVPIAVGDLSIWTALGIDSLNNLKIITEDTYTVSSTSSMVYPVLICWVYGLIYKIGGMALLTSAHAFIPAVWMSIWYRFAKKQSSTYQSFTHLWDLKLLSIFFLSYLGSTLIYIARPALVGTIPLLYSYYLITILKDKIYSKKDLLLFFIIEVIWVNIHGSFLILPIMLGWQVLFLIFQKKFLFVQNRLIAIALTLLASLINPFTWKVIPYTWETALISKARGLDEWFPPYYFSYPFSSVYFYISAAVLIAYLLKFYFNNKSLNQLLSLLSNPYFLLVFSGFGAIRNVFFTFLMAPIFILSEVILTPAKSFSENSRSSKIANAVVVALLIVICALLSPFNKRNLASYLEPNIQFVYNRYYRVEKINTFLQNHSGDIFNTWGYGSDLALAQTNKYFIDTRNIIFSDDVNRQYEDFINHPDENSEVLTRYNFKYFLVNKDHKLLYRWFSNQNGFKLILEEGPAGLFEKIQP